MVSFVNQASIIWHVHRLPSQDADSSRLMKLHVTKAVVALGRQMRETVYWLILSKFQQL